MKRDWRGRVHDGGRRQEAKARYGAWVTEQFDYVMREGLRRVVDDLRETLTACNQEPK